MRILALDHGDRRIGVAMSDELQMIAHPVCYLSPHPFADFVEKLRELMKEKEVELILIGMPRNMDGSYGPAALKVQEFVAALKSAITIPVQTVDERLTTVQAQKFLRAGGTKSKNQRQRIDQTAAAIMLQSFLDSRPV